MIFRTSGRTGESGATHAADETAMLERALNILIDAGEFLGALECFYADDVVVHRADGGETTGRAAARAREAALIAARVRLTARLLESAVRGATSFSEWAYRLELPSGRTLEYSQVAVRTWRIDRVAHERIFHAPLPAWAAEELRRAQAPRETADDADESVGNE